MKDDTSDTIQEMTNIIVTHKACFGRVFLCYKFMPFPKSIQLFATRQQTKKHLL